MSVFFSTWKGLVFLLLPEKNLILSYPRAFALPVPLFGRIFASLSRLPFICLSASYSSFSIQCFVFKEAFQTTPFCGRYLQSFSHSPNHSIVSPFKTLIIPICVIHSILLLCLHHNMYTWPGTYFASFCDPQKPA